MDDHKLRSFFFSKSEAETIITALKAQNKLTTDKEEIRLNEYLQEELKNY